MVRPKTEEKLMSNIMRSGSITVITYLGGGGRLRCLLGRFIWLWICSNISVLI